VRDGSAAPSASDANTSTNNTSTTNTTNTTNTTSPASTSSNVDVERVSAELVRAHKRAADAAQAQLDLQHQMKKLQNQCSRYEDEIDDWKERLSKAQSRCAFLDDQVHEKETTVQVLRDELQALQIELIKAEEKTKILADENAMLIDKYMKRVNDEAAQMNEAQRLFNEVKKAAAASELERRVASEATLNVPSSSRRKGSLTTSATPPAQLRKSFMSHRGEVTSLAFNGVGSLFATASSDKTVKLWDARTGAHHSSLSGSMQTVMSVAFSPSGEFVLGACNDNTARLWSVEKGVERHTLTGHVGKVFSVAFSTDGGRVATGSHDRTLKLWDLQKGHCVRTIFCFSSCNTVALSRDGFTLVSGHFDSSLRFWSTEKGESKHELSNLHDKAQITSVTLSSDDTTLLSCGRDDTLRLVDMRSFDVVRSFQSPAFRAGLNWTKATLSPDNAYVAAPGHEGAIFVWDCRTSALVATLTGGHEGIAACVAWNPTSKLVVSGDRVGKVAMWE
jgi:autophagy-related protein 16